MIFRRQKIFDGMVDVYDYIVEQHIRANKTLRIVIGDEYMDLDPKRLKKPIKKSESYASKWTAGQTYKLYSYTWTPQKEQSMENPYAIKFTYKN